MQARDCRDALLGRYRAARDVLADTLWRLSEGRLSVPVPSQGLHLVARFDVDVKPAIAAQARADARMQGWLLAEACVRTRPIAGFILGFAGHPIAAVEQAAGKLARASIRSLVSATA